MSSLPPEIVRDRVCAQLAVIDAAHARLRGLSTDLVGNAFRIEVAGRLETQDRVTRGLSYRVCGEIADPPDGPDDPGLPPGVKVIDLLRSRLHLTADEVRRRMKVAARIRPRRSLTGPPRPPELPALAAAVEAGAVGEDHIRETFKGLDRLPRDVSPADRDTAEQILVTHATTQDAVFVATVGRKIAETLNPDGVFDDRDRPNRRRLTLGPQGVDGLSKLSGYLTPTARAAFEAVAAAVRPGHHLPGSDQSVVDARTDTRSKSQRLHDAFEWGLGTALASGPPRHPPRPAGHRHRHHHPGRPGGGGRGRGRRSGPADAGAGAHRRRIGAADARPHHPGRRTDPLPGGVREPLRADRCTWAGRDGWPARISGSSATPATGAAPTPTAPNRATTAK